MATPLEELIALEIARSRGAAQPDRLAARLILQIPEIAEGVEMRAQRRAVLDLDSAEGRREAVRRINDLIEALQLDDGFHSALVGELRGLAADLA